MFRYSVYAVIPVALKTAFFFYGPKNLEIKNDQYFNRYISKSCFIVII